MIRGLNHLTFAVSDLDRSIRFYRDVLGFKVVSHHDGDAYLSAGGLWIALVVDNSRLETISRDYSHIAFDVEQGEFDILKRRLEEHGSPCWSENSTEGDSYYFLDPDGHRLEIHVGSLDSRLSHLQSLGAKGDAVGETCHP